MSLLCAVVVLSMSHLSSHWLLKLGEIGTKIQLWSRDILSKNLNIIMSKPYSISKFLFFKWENWKTSLKRSSCNGYPQLCPNHTPLFLLISKYDEQSLKIHLKYDTFQSTLGRVEKTYQKKKNQAAKAPTNFSNQNAYIKSLFYKLWIEMDCTYLTELFLCNSKA